MAIRMLVTHTGSPDGIHIFEYVAGREYSATSRPPVSDDLAAVFVRERWAELVQAEPPRMEGVTLTGPSVVLVEPGPSMVKRPGRKKVGD